MTVEVVPRRRRSRLELLVQTGVAVVAGMAAMYIVQNYQAGRQFSAAAPAPAPAAAPAPAGPADGLEAPRRVTGRPQAEDHMRVIGERGVAPPAMVGVFGEQSPDRTGAPRRGKAVRLEPRRMDSDFSALGSGAEGIGRGFDRVDFAPLAEPRPVVVPGAPTVGRMATVAKKGPDAEHAVSSPLRPEDWGRAPFWTRERQARVGAAAAVSVGGFAYLLAASGFLAGRKPERKEGEL
ncbi:MAG: hypothetical protein SF051_02245 [Elusimicrobiota bacterium]|nr:hypothetical protein [Elusimicrobiota bacterium]